MSVHMVSNGIYRKISVIISTVNMIVYNIQYYSTNTKLYTAHSLQKQCSY